MPETFSHSRLSSFETCPLQYRFRYIDGLPRPWRGVEAHMGTAVHAALEKMFIWLRRGQVPTLADVEAWFGQAWGKEREAALRVVRGGFVPEDYRQLGLHCLRSSFDRLLELGGQQVLHVEEKVDFTLDRDGNDRIIGYVDRIDAAPDGALEIHDYKTSGSLPRARDLDADRQLTFYEMAVRRLYPAVQSVRQVWHYLTFGKTFIRTRDAGYLERIRTESRALIRRIREARGYPARPGMLCHWCDFLEECGEGQSYAARRPVPGIPSAQASGEQGPPVTGR